MGYNAVGDIESIDCLEVVDMARPITDRINLDDAIQDYLSGESLYSLSSRYGVNRRGLTLHFQKRGVAIRDRSAGQQLRNAHMTREQRLANTAAAHTAMRGKKFPGKGAGRVNTLGAKLKLAQTRQIRQLSVDPAERQLAEMLMTRGLSVIPQQAVGIYNCDIGAYPVAVEVYGGGWHFYGRHLARAPKRLRYFLDAGWHVLIVVVSDRFPLSPVAADYIATFSEHARSHPSLTREYRMIRGAAELIASGSADDDEVAVIPAIRSSRDSLGRYTTVPG